MVEQEKSPEGQVPARLTDTESEQRESQKRRKTSKGRCEGGFFSFVGRKRKSRRGGPRKKNELRDRD
jgi:hypothetical protein